MIQLLLLLVLLLAMFMTWRRLKQKAIRPVEAYVWSLVWLGAAVVVVQPDITSRVAQFVGVGRGADLVVYTAVIVLLILVFRLHVAHAALERTLTDLVRREALRDAQGAQSHESIVSSPESPDSKL